MASFGGFVLAPGLIAHAAIPSAADPEPPVELPIPDDFHFSEQWGLFNYGQDIADGRLLGTAGADLHIPEAWTITSGSPEVVVAVIDTGGSYDHPDLAANVWTNPGESGRDAVGRDRRDNGIDDDGNGYVDDWRGWDFVDDDNDPRGPIAGTAERGSPFQHGTAVAGVIAAVADNGVGIAGVAPRTKVMILRAGTDGGRPGFGSARTTKALAYATAMGARIVNLSYGGPPVLDDGSAEKAVMSTHPDVLFVAAAGNSGNTVDRTGFVPCTHGLPNVVCVAASGPHDELARWPDDVADAGEEGSNWGRAVDVAAPGLGILTLAPARRVVASFGFEDGLTEWTAVAGSAPWRVVEGAGRAGGAALAPPATPSATGDSLRLLDPPDLAEAPDCFLSVWVDTSRSVPREGSLQVRRSSRRDGRYVFGVGGLQVSAATNGPGWTRHVVQLPTDDTDARWWELHFDTGTAGAEPGLLLDDLAIACSTTEYGSDDYTYAYGTSFAAPLVSGVAALAAAVAPELDGAALRDVIVEGADPATGLAQIAGGRVNAWRTVVLAAQRAAAAPASTTAAGATPSPPSTPVSTARGSGRALDWALRTVYRLAPNRRSGAGGDSAGSTAPDAPTSAAAGGGAGPRSLVPLAGGVAGGVVLTASVTVYVRRRNRLRDASRAVLDTAGDSASALELARIPADFAEAARSRRVELGDQLRRRKDVLWRLSKLTGHTTGAATEASLDYLRAQAAVARGGPRGAKLALMQLPQALAETLSGPVKVAGRAVPVASGILSAYEYSQEPDPDRPAVRNIADQTMAGAGVVSAVLLAGGAIAVTAAAAPVAAFGATALGVGTLLGTASGTWSGAAFVHDLVADQLADLDRA